ncbi:hypothetical protein TNIN_417901 [Trichonephila inaurata madagascariensis]|uniref:Uncharacterized protein n=1 Tax=Trichonephila inaurata madagascariensis TaxID=2747483 RepID=A0A8X6XP43_9ARAC|nr:hypothetical protein TNIN_417901 [Trichonephila inaurata madagascariensis]
MGENHRTRDCPNKGKVENLHCINCNKAEHVEFLRSCSKFPQLKPKQDEKSNSVNDKGNNNSVTASARPPLLLSKKKKFPLPLPLTLEILQLIL